ncbi:MAG: TetR/AcrR family transcriptional regulator [Eubacterium sp.]
MDSTSQKIIDSAMCLVRDKGYVATTTKEIAQKAGVNECTLFRKFESKKDIVLSGMEQLKWRADVSPELFKNVKWDLEQDLQMFMSVYMDKITPDFVKLSIGLRAPQIYEETAPMIMKVPQAFVSAITDYFYEMEKRGKIKHTNYESLAMTVFSSAFGFTFLKASFNDELSSVQKDEYIKESVELFLKGLNQ